MHGRIRALLGGVLLCIAAADSAVVARHVEPVRVPLSVELATGSRSLPAAEAERTAKQRDAAIAALFDARAAALRARDERAFLATLDPEQHDFRDEQKQVFDSLGLLDFATWEYDATGDSYDISVIDWHKYAGVEDVWLPVVTLRYQLRGFDEKPVGRRVVYTVVRRGKHWHIAADRDLEEVTSSGTSVRVDPWENGPIVVKRDEHALVIGHPQDADSLDGIRAEVDDAVEHVTTYVGAWQEKTVVVLPADHEELNHVLEDPDVPYDFAAVAMPLWTRPGEDDFAQRAGARVVINPKYFRPNVAFNRMLLRHEMTHVATFARTGPLTPKWLVEGIAEWVGNAGAPYPTARLGTPLAEQIERQGLPNHLPLDSDFGIIDDASIGYNEGWLLCRYIASHYGRAKLLAFYAEMGSVRNLTLTTKRLDDALRTVLGTDRNALLGAWRAYLRSVVGDLDDMFVVPGRDFVADEGTEHLGAGDAPALVGVSRQEGERLGLERGALASYVAGDAERLVKEEVIVVRDEQATAAVLPLVAKMVSDVDPHGRAVPHGRLYRFSARLDRGGTYEGALVVVRAGVTVLAVRVLYRSGDPTAAATALAQRMYAAALRA